MRNNFLKLSLKRMSVMETMLSFTPIDQNQVCVAKNSINIFQGNIIDDMLPLVFLSHLLLNG